VTQAQELVDALLDAGELVDEGGFTIDGDHARAKLRHGLTDPDSYVVVLARAALLRGATRIDIEPGWTRTRVSFDGRALRADELAELSSFRELEGDQPGDAASRRALTQALTAALAPRAARASEAEARPIPATRARVLRVLEGRLEGLELSGEQTRPHAAGPAPAERSTVVELTHRRTLARLAEVSTLATPEHRWARQSLVFVDPAVVRLGGQTWPLSGPLSLGIGSKADRFVDLHPLGLEGFAANRSRHPDATVTAAKVAVVVGGIKIGSKPLPPDFEHIDDAVVRDDRLRLDASGFDVVADERWHALLSRLREADATWTELPKSMPTPRDPRTWLVPNREHPPERWAETGTWPNFIAWLTVWFIPGIVVMDFDSYVHGTLLAVFVVPLLAIVRSVLKKRRVNTSNLRAHVPTGATLVSALLYCLGAGLCLVRLLVDAAG
jgi:hypothetical protein